jgi:hypothetical protein
MKNNFYKKNNLTDETTNTKPTFNSETNIITINQLLENETQNNKHDNWNKIDKYTKLQTLHTYAEKYGKENNLSIKEVKLLKSFFNDCLEKTKLQKTKEVVYDKETKKITFIPYLHYNKLNNRFTLKIDDTKRISTLKSLTPKRSITDKNRSSSTNEEFDELDATTS